MRSATETHLLRALLHLAIPVLAEESLMILVGYTDWWLVGHYLGSTPHKAAMGLMSYLLWLLPSLFAAVSIGSTALVARLVGGADHAAARRVTHQALLVGGVLAVLATVVTATCGERFIHAMQLESEAAVLAARYLAILVPVIPFIMLEQVASACLRGAGDTVSSFLAKCAVNLVNMTVSTLLIIGPGVIPKLGWQGLALGTAIGHLIGGTILLSLLLRGRAGLKIQPSGMRPDRQIMRRLLRIGLPGGLDVLSVLACHLAYVAIINSLGTLSAAAHGLGVQIEALAYLPGAAFMVAATTMSGQLLGGGQPQRATRGVLLASAVGCSVMTVAALVFFFGGTFLTAFFTGDVEDPVGRLTASLLKIVAISTPALGVVQIVTGGLRGAGDTRVPLAITFIGLLLIRIPLACWFAWDEFEIPALQWTVRGWNGGIYGAWWAMTIDVFLRAMLTAARFLQGGWKELDV